MMSIFWFILFIIFIIIEVLTINLVTIWFAIGALITGISAFFIDNVILLWIIFIVTSIIDLLITKPLIKKFKLNKVEPTNLDRVIGKIGFVSEDILPHKIGEVKVDGKRWSAIASQKIYKDSKVEILAIDGVKLRVKEVKESD